MPQRNNKTKTINRQADERSHEFKATKSEILKKVRETDWIEQVKDYVNPIEDTEEPDIDYTEI